jgi:hypothetical protein
MRQQAVNKGVDDMAEAKGTRTEQSSAGVQSGAEEEWYDLLPVEKKLIGYSLLLGVVLLVVFIFAFGVIK